MTTVSGLETPGFWCVEWHSELGSTMERAADVALEGAPASTVIVADYQSRGRGTHGRGWHAPSGSCLMFTVLVRPALTADRLTEIPIRVATSVSGVLNDAFHICADVKPPNDVVVNGRKVCGVLCSSHITGTRLDWMLCGIGLNTWMRPSEMPLGPATSLFVERSGNVPRHDELLEMILHRLVWLRDL